MAIKVFKYKKEYHVKSYEVDCHGFLRVVTLMNLLQEAAVESAEVLGFGFEKCRSQGVSWVGANYLIKITKLPKIDEKIEIETWPAEGKLWGAIRNFVIKNQKNELMISAKSQWVLIDTARRRPVSLSKYFPEYDFLDEPVMDDDFHKTEPIENPDTVKEFAVRFDDIDINNHVNNAVYPLWASEGIEPAYRMEHTPAEIEICFKKEALWGESVKVLNKQSGDNSFHIITDSTDEGKTLAECRFVWKKITSKSLETKPCAD